MPTGYTATLCDKEQSFGEFALGCARAFGACIGQRDDPLSDLPKSAERDNYHVLELRRAETELAVLLDMSDADRIELGTTARDDEIIHYQAAVEKRKVVHERLSRMIATVEGWNPPTPDHDNLKKFMLEQLATTIKHDGDVEYYQTQLNSAINKTPLDYYNEKVKSAQWNVDYHKKEQVKADSRVDDRNGWISALYKSLSEVDPEVTALLLKNS
ncbi:MAG TPA: hypothetical protein VFM18_17915 [Methanosarcina sp.]|nr:hypothetical protein [Methanosarcina sp.]